MLQTYCRNACVIHKHCRNTAAILDEYYGDSAAAKQQNTAGIFEEDYYGNTVELLETLCRTVAGCSTPTTWEYI